MERLRVEYKAHLTAAVLDGLDSDIASYANAKGGEILFGVDDQGRPTGVRLTDIDRQRIADRAARCRPPIPIDFEEREHEGHLITAVLVSESPSIHADERHRFPIRIGNLKQYLDTSGLLLLARAKGLEFASGPTVLGWPPGETKKERVDLPQDMAGHFVETLQSDNALIRSETLKNLDTVLYRYRIERDARIMELLIVQSGHLTDADEGRPLDLLRYILLQASEEDRAHWVKAARETALSICRAAPSASAVQQAQNFLSAFSEPEDIGVIVWIVTTWSKELYLHARPLSWLDGLRSAGHRFPAQQAFVRQLQEVKDQEIIERIKECLEHLRRN